MQGANVVHSDKKNSERRKKKCKRRKTKKYSGGGFKLVRCFHLHRLGI
jgi:hypothetical protein